MSNYWDADRTYSRRTVLKAGGIAFTLATLGPLVEACTTSSTTTGSGLAGGTLKWAVPVELVDWDPQNSYQFSSWEIMNRVYEGLVSIADDFSVMPLLASSWDQPNDTTYVFHLRPGVKFSNGRLMTVDDVVGSLQRLLSPKEGAYWAAGQLQAIQDVSPGSNGTVQITLKTPSTPILAALAHLAASILPMKEINEGSFDPTKAMMGTGPFMVAAHIPGASWTLKKNPLYWRQGYPLLDEIDVQVVTDDSARLAALRDGSTHISVFANTDADQLLKAINNVKVVVQNTAAYHLIELNSVAAGNVFQDQRIRQAFSLGIDRKQLLSVVSGGLGEVTGPVSATFKVIDTSKLPYMQYDPSRAKQLLQAAGHSSLQFDLITNREGTYSWLPIAEGIKSQLAQIGVTVNILSLENGDALQRWYNSYPSKSDANIDAFSGYTDPGMDLNYWNPTNASSFQHAFMAPDQQLIDIVTKANSTPNGPQRKQLLQDAAIRADSDALQLPLFTYPFIIGYRSDLLQPTLQPSEGYQNNLRHVDSYRVLKK